MQMIVMVRNLNWCTKMLPAALHALACWAIERQGPLPADPTPRIVRANLSSTAGSDHVLFSRL